MSSIDTPALEVIGDETPEQREEGGTTVTGVKLNCWDRVRVIAWEGAARGANPPIGALGTVVTVYADPMTLWWDYRVDIEGRGVCPVKATEIEKVTE